MIRLNFLIRFCFGILLCLSVVAVEGRAAGYLVTNTNDSGGGSLRAAINAANQNSDADTIAFDPSVFFVPRTITLTSTGFVITNPLTINGPGARLLTIGRDQFSSVAQVFGARNGAAVTLSGMTVSGGTSNGGISNNAGTMTLDRMHLTGNFGYTGGGIDNEGTMIVINSLIEGNGAQYTGGGIFNTGTLSIANTTIANNFTFDGSGSGAGGIQNMGTVNLNNITVIGNTTNGADANSAGGIVNAGSVNVRNTIISTNRRANDESSDVSGAFTSNGNNLVRNTIDGTGFGLAGSNDITGAFPMLDDLQNNGGDTDTRLPTATSPAVNRGNNCVLNFSCATNNPPVPLNFDQHGTGYPRRNGAAIDIGAAESSFNPTVAGTTAGGRVTEPNGRGIYRVLITMTDQTGNQRQAYTNQLGYFQFEDVAGGQVYIFSAFHRRYQFEQPTQVQFIGEENDGINFIGSPFGIFRFDIWNLPTKRIE